MTLDFHALMQNPDDFDVVLVIPVKYQMLVFGDGSVAISYFRAVSS